MQQTFASLLECWCMVVFNFTTPSFSEKGSQLLWLKIIINMVGQGVLGASDRKIQVCLSSVFKETVSSCILKSCHFVLDYERAQ